jgi:hypothetical protein
VRRAVGPAGELLERACGFVGVVISLEDLPSSIFVYDRLGLRLLRRA